LPSPSPPAPSHPPSASPLQSMEMA
jgi:hypothetical protein